MKKIRKFVFIVPVSIMIAALCVYTVEPIRYINAMESMNIFIGKKMGWFYCVVGLLLCGICAGVYFSPLGDKVVGGENAKPLLKKWNWFCVSLCTTMAAGILFWSAAEPVIHLVTPPEFLHLESNSYEAGIFSMSTLFLHWGITPYAIYCAPAVMFAFVYYNMGKTYGFSHCLQPLLGEKKITRNMPKYIDTLCLFITATGLAASLGMGILSVSGGLAQSFRIQSNTLILVLIGAGIVIAFVVSSTSGIMKGIKWLSVWNTRIFIAILLFALLMGPTSFIVNYFSESFGYYISHFFEKSLMLGAGTGSDWTRLWSVQYFGSWLAWAPMTALFLGKIAYGHKFKDMILFNLILPSMFSMVWVGILGGNAVYLQLHDTDLVKVIDNTGIENVLYEVFRSFPFSDIVIPILTFTVFLSFVTAADSTTNAMANLCVSTARRGTGEPPKTIKIILGVLIGLISIIMVTGKGVDGIKILSTIAGLPAAILIAAVGISLIKVMRVPDRYMLQDKEEKDEGRK